MKQPVYALRGGVLSSLVTVFWVLAGMVVLAVGGFLFSYKVFASKLPKSEMQFERPRPTRILTPEEARRLANSEPSPVWTEGVKPSDIPKMEGTDKPKRTRKSTQVKPKPVPSTTETQPGDTGTADTPPDGTTPDTGTVDTPPTTDTTPPPSGNDTPAPEPGLSPD